MARLTKAEKAELARKEKDREYTKAWYQAHKEQKKLQVYAWRKANPEKYKAIQERCRQTRTRKKPNPALSSKVRQEQLARHKARRAAEIAAARKAVR